MLKWLTTGQMIDRLEEEQIAKNNKGGYVKRKAYGFIWCESDGTYFENKLFPINDITIELKWLIVPERKVIRFGENWKDIIQD